MNAKNFNIIIIILFCCALCSGREENSIEKSDPNIVQTESVDENVIDNDAGEHDMQETSVKGFDPNEPQKKEKKN